MAGNRTLSELSSFVDREYGGITPDRGTPYPCTQEQIDSYTLEPYCCWGNNNLMSEHDATTMLEDFLDSRRALTDRVRSALRRIADAMSIKDSWYPDVVIKAMHDVDTAFFMGYLKGNVSIQWTSQIRLTELENGATHTYGSTLYQRHGCSVIWLNMQAVFHASEFPRRKMWQVLFHELIVSPPCLTL